MQTGDGPENNISITIEWAKSKTAYLWVYFKAWYRVHMKLPSQQRLNGSIDIDLISKRLATPTPNW